jgi:hypothetical protein
MMNCKGCGRNRQWPNLMYYLSSSVVWWLPCLPLDPGFMSSNPAEGDRFFKGDKHSQHTFFRRGSEAAGPMS